jgi:hypothetical protein
MRQPDPGGFVIHLVAEPLRVLAGLRRVLRPGASVALTTPGPCEDHGRWNAWNTLVGQFASRSRGAAGARLRGRAVLACRRLRGHPHREPRGPPASGQSANLLGFPYVHGFAAVDEALNPADAAEFQRRALTELTRMHESGGIMLDRGAVAHVATVPANDPSEPGSHS